MRQRSSLIRILLALLFLTGLPVAGHDMGRPIPGTAGQNAATLAPSDEATPSVTLASSLAASEDDQTDPDDDLLAGDGRSATGALAQSPAAHRASRACVHRTPCSHRSTGPPRA